MILETLPTKKLEAHIRFQESLAAMFDEKHEPSQARRVRDFVKTLRAELASRPPETQEEPEA